MKVRSRCPAKWVLVAWLPGLKECEFYREGPNGSMGFTPLLAKATKFDSEKDAERYAGLKGLTWVWFVRADLLAEWMVIMALRSDVLLTKYYSGLK